MHCAPFLLTMQIIFASVSYRRVVADLRYKKNKSIVLMPIDPDAFRFKKPEE